MLLSQRGSKLLILTQKIDCQDDVLGFFHGWVQALAGQFEFINVICLEQGQLDLPTNVKVYSLGKEKKHRRWQYLFRFYRLIISLRHNYDTVFVHMNQEYILLGSLLWRHWGKKIFLWYNHTTGTIWTRLAMKLAQRICHTSPYAFTAGTEKSLRLPAGIDTDYFRPIRSIKKTANSILYLGRIAPVKKIHILIAAVKKLNCANRKIILDIYGGSSAKDQTYLENLRQSAAELTKLGQINFCGRIPYLATPEIYNAHEILINLTPRGNYDKTVLEAMACETLVAVSSQAFSDLLPENCFFSEEDPVSLTVAIGKLLDLSLTEKLNAGRKFRHTIIDRHDLKKLAQQLRQM